MEGLDSDELTTGSLTRQLAVEVRRMISSLDELHSGSGSARRASAGG